MARETVARCIWLVDTIRRYGRVTRGELQRAWERSSFYDGNPLARRTFCNHRDVAEEIFGVTIKCDPHTYEYYICDEDSRAGVANWLLDSVAMSETLGNARDIADRIFVENVPSAREHLSTVIDALKQKNRLRFDYHPYTRSLPTTGIVIEPYSLKLFKQRWYMVGRVPSENRIKTYALDRVKKAVVLPEPVESNDFDVQGYFSHSYGIVVTQAEPRRIVLRANPRRAKYLRALPLHESQSESVGDGYSLFTYYMRVTDDFEAELLSCGSEITVLEPPELRKSIEKSLRESLKNYEEN